MKTCRSERRIWVLVRLRERSEKGRRSPSSPLAAGERRKEDGGEVRKRGRGRHFWDKGLKEEGLCYVCIYIIAQRNFHLSTHMLILIIFLTPRVCMLTIFLPLLHNIF